MLIANAFAAELLRDLAAQLQSGEIDNMAAFFYLAAPATLLNDARENLQRTYFSPLFVHSLAAESHSTALRDIVRRWADNEITSTDVPSALAGIDTMGELERYRNTLLANGMSSGEIEGMMARLEQDMEHALSGP